MSNLTNNAGNSISISITVYEAKQKQYPKSEEEWDSYEGILLPGSFSSAYSEDEEWIKELKRIIQTDIHPKGRKTFGVCFGHQIFAHSFHNSDSDKDNDSSKKGHEEKDCTATAEGAGGLAVPCPKGMQIGSRLCKFEMDPHWAPRKSESNGIIGVGIGGLGGGEYETSANLCNRICLSNSRILYTHGDMVHSLPNNCAVSLGGTEFVPIQGAVYYKREKRKLTQMHGIGHDEPNSDVMQDDPGHTAKHRPYAFTLQGHPEYATSDVGIQTYFNILRKMEERSKSDDNDFKLNPNLLSSAKKDALELKMMKSIEADCIHLMQIVVETLGWI